VKKKDFTKTFRIHIEACLIQNQINLIFIVIRRRNILAELVQL